VTVRIVPFANALYVPPDFTIMEFEDVKLNFGYTETLYGVVKKEVATPEFKQFTDTWQIVDDTALNTEASIELLDGALRRAGSPRGT
jgi:hypothetical protein